MNNEFRPFEKFERNMTPSQRVVFRAMFLVVFISCVVFLAIDLDVFNTKLPSTDSQVKEFLLIIWIVVLIAMMLGGCAIAGVVVAFTTVWVMRGFNPRHDDDD